MSRSCLFSLTPYHCYQLDHRFRIVLVFPARPLLRTHSGDSGILLENIITPSGFRSDSPRTVCVFPLVFTARAVRAVCYLTSWKLGGWKEVPGSRGERSEHRKRRKAEDPPPAIRTTARERLPSLLPHVHTCVRTRAHVTRAVHPRGEIAALALHLPRV